MGLNLHDEDAFGPIDTYVERMNDLSNLVCLTNLKVRLLLDLRMLESEPQKPGNDNADYDKKMGWKRRDIVERANWTDLITDLVSQIRRLVQYVDERNGHYWPALELPERWSASMPVPYIWGSPQEIGLVFRETWYTFAECPPVREIRREEIHT